MRLSKWICPWCEKHRLEYVEAFFSDSRSPTDGIKLACFDPTEFNCPDTTGLCKTEAEADSHASELCKEAAHDINEGAA